MSQTVQVPCHKWCTSDDMEKVTLAHTDVDLAEARRRMTELFPSRKYHQLWQLAHYAETGQTFDVTFFGREPSLEVTLTQEFAFEFLSAAADGRVDDINRLRSLVRSLASASMNAYANSWVSVTSRLGSRP